MVTREAACHCGQLRLTVTGDPTRVTLCNCLACQRRTGSAFGIQAAFAADQVEVTGRSNDFTRISDPPQEAHVFHFCPDCGSTVFNTNPTEPDVIIVAVGAFADPTFPPPSRSIYESRRHPWLGLPDSIERQAPELWWGAAGALYQEGRFAEAAEIGRALIADWPDDPYLLYNVACCESLAGSSSDAIGHLRRAIELAETCRGMARDDADFDPIRDEPAVRDLLAERAP
jgi:hypothetical protein